jgi:pilus assembly protein TadC
VDVAARRVGEVSGPAPVVVVAVTVGAALVLTGAKAPVRRTIEGQSTGDRLRRRWNRVARLWTPAVAGLALVALVAIVGPFAALAVALTGTLAVVARRRRRERDRARSIEAAVPDAIDLLVATVRAGCTPVAAVRSVAALGPVPVRPAFATVVTRTERGQRFADALSALPELLGPNAAALADGLAASDRYGTPLAPLLERLALEARAVRRRNAEAAARTLPVRLAFPLVVCTLPSFVLLAVVPALLGTLSSLRDGAP